MSHHVAMRPRQSRGEKPGGSLYLVPRNLKFAHNERRVVWRVARARARIADEQLLARRDRRFRRHCDNRSTEDHLSKEELLEFDGTVTEVLPDGNYRVRLDNEHELL